MPLAVDRSHISNLVHNSCPVRFFSFREYPTNYQIGGARGRKLSDRLSNHSCPMTELDRAAPNHCAA